MRKTVLKRSRPGLSCQALSVPLQLPLNAPWTIAAYFRARISLANGDFLEVSEYFLAGPEGCATIEYRHQWMDSTRHFPELANFPHHIHLASETNAVPGTVMSVIELIDLLEAELE